MAGRRSDRYRYVSYVHDSMLIESRLIFALLRPPAPGARLGAQGVAIGNSQILSFGGSSAWPLKR